MTPPTVTLQATASGRNIRLTWIGNDGNGSGVIAYAVQAQINGQAWIDWLPVTSQTQGVYPGEVGKTYVFRVQAIDAVGRLSDWSQSEPVSVQRVVTKYYFLGNQRVAMRQGDEVYYLHGDHLGSVSLVTDSEGQVVSEARYTPYGRLHNGNTGPTDIGFTDQRYEAGFGLNDYNARFYSPYLGRFISPDSIVPEPGNPQNLNRYTYVLNNPLKFSDPTGHCAEQEGSGSGLCTRFTDDGSFRIVRGGSYFVNNTEVALANYILSGNSDYLNGVPEDPGVFLADSVNSVAGNLGYGDPGINLPLDPMVAAGASMAFGNHVEDEISSGSVLVKGQGRGGSSDVSNIAQTLRSNGQVDAPPGTMSTKLMGEVSNELGNAEVGLFRLESGKRVMTLGEANRLAIPPDTKRIIAHIHPSGNFQFSFSDVLELTGRGQRSSVIVNPAGEGCRLPVSSSPYYQKFFGQ